MTYALPRSQKAGTQSLKTLGAVFIDDRAESLESDFIKKEFERSMDHYLLPFTMQWSNPIIRFFSLKKEWEAATAHLSSTTKIAIHPAYQQIIGMGQIAIPLILSEMKKQPDHWFWALRSITGEDPVLPEHKGKLRQMTEDWLKWGRRNGYPA